MIGFCPDGSCAAHLKRTGLCFPPIDLYTAAALEEKRCGRVAAAPSHQHEERGCLAS